MSIYYRRGPRITLGRIVTSLALRIHPGAIAIVALFLIFGAFAR